MKAVLSAGALALGLCWGLTACAPADNDAPAVVVTPTVEGPPGPPGPAGEPGAPAPATSSTTVTTAPDTKVTVESK